MNKLENKIHLFNKDLAIILASLAYHISPEIVRYIVEANKKDIIFFEKLFGDKIDTKNYLFNGSDCVFPGIRRYVSGEGKKQKYNTKYCAIIDDNTFPRHIWCFLINGKCYTGPNWKETNLEEFELAHIFTHKESEIIMEKNYFKEIDNNISPHGEFTSAANVVLLPKGTVRPTDNSTIGEDSLNGRKGFIENKVPEWYSEIKWNEPFLPEKWRKNINSLLDYRKERITTIIGKI
ncbi:hypothetical protein AGMMS49959_13330 [Planctomycetales bacterium]|nr:hypothetical protein AGMMS49959_13330 [Planctomycetales bacterium]